MNTVAELFGYPSNDRSVDWKSIVAQQQCPFLGKTCYKVRKSDPQTSIGSCTVLYGRHRAPILICPARLLERRQVFTDCLHLLTAHEPGDELHVVPEISVPGGSVDYFLLSARAGEIKDFVGIELQTLDTTGTVWPDRQRLLRRLGVVQRNEMELSSKPFGMNWKHTAKTTLVQMLHKVETFEHLDKRLVLVLQDRLLEYMQSNFDFGHLRPAEIADAMHFHAYRVEAQDDSSYRVSLHNRLSTDAEGIAVGLGLRADPRIELSEIHETLSNRIGSATLFNPT